MPAYYTFNYENTLDRSVEGLLVCFVFKKIGSHSIVGIEVTEQSLSLIHFILLELAFTNTIGIYPQQKIRILECCKDLSMVVAMVSFASRKRAQINVLESSLSIRCRVSELGCNGLYRLKHPRMSDSIIGTC